jgi:hypothetical protein
MAALKAAATRRGRLLELHGLDDEQSPSLDAMVAQNAILRLVESMVRRLATLEREAHARTERFEVTPDGRRALAEPQEMAS